MSSVVQPMKSNGSQSKSALFTQNALALPDLRPWAAYVIGHNSTLLRVWQYLSWVWNGRLDTESGVPCSIEEIERGMHIMSDDIPERARAMLKLACKRFALVNKQPPTVPFGHENDWAYWFTDDESTGYPEWDKLVSRASDALGETSPWHGWYQLGVTVATFQKELFIRYKPQEFPSIQPVVRAADALFERGWRGVQEIDRLASYARNTPWMPTQQILAIVVETPDCYLTVDRDPSDISILLLRQAVRLNQQLRATLHEGTRVLRECHEESPLAELKPQEQLVLTSFQKSILEALNGQGLTKPKLADKLKCEERRLYKNGGIKDLMAAGLVANKRGVGYYRPDAPPHGTVQWYKA